MAAKQKRRKRNLEGRSIKPFKNQAVLDKILNLPIAESQEVDAKDVWSLYMVCRSRGVVISARKVRGKRVVYRIA